MWETMGRMYRTEGGVSALYRGIVPTVAGVAPYVRHITDVVVSLDQRHVADNWTGWLELHGVRVSTEISHEGG